MAFDKIVGVDGTTYQFPSVVRQRIADNIETVGSVENLAVIDALAPALATKSNTTHNHTLASLSSNAIDELGDVEIGVVGGNGIALADKHTLQYEEATLKWRNKVASGGVTVKDTPPASPIPGDAWFDSNDGTLYVYYTDVNTAQWVQVQANSALEGTILSRLGALESRATALEAVPDYSPNYIINGAMDIWQRGTSFTTPSGGAYTADRWQARMGVPPSSIARSTDVPSSGFKYSLEYSRTSTTVTGVTQRIEAANAVMLVGKAITVSFWHKRTGADGTLNVVFAYPSALDDYTTTTVLQTNTVAASSSTSWTRYTTTLETVPASFANGFEIAVRANTSSSATVSGLFTGVQLEEGSVATPFRRNANSIQGELAACQRYYYRNTATATGSQLGHGWGTGTTTAVISVNFPVSMRVSPTAIDFSGLQLGNNIDGGLGAVTGASILSAQCNTDNGMVSITASSLGMRNAYWLQSSSASSYIGFTAEL